MVYPLWGGQGGCLTFFVCDDKRHKYKKLMMLNISRLENILGTSARQKEGRIVHIHGVEDTRDSGGELQRDH